ncbi:uncharacterized protein I206_101395 [Kwoniella pini CBS 10737]|uniref:Uncharacterized protein n=1 Tax=Kwoniella pini CBS 10737 TaxID=1296096 RepID=A0A1B9HWV0_9TREE|nr:uncharacterized protein I206_06635 [Kwoniella pini CBS 10737]OCF47729.1 hypothetical protein I206_06635 [Kwoniella pini CBS 10737]
MPSSRFRRWTGSRSSNQRTSSVVDQFEGSYGGKKENSQIFYCAKIYNKNNISTVMRYPKYPSHKDICEDIETSIKQILEHETEELLSKTLSSYFGDKKLSEQLSNNSYTSINEKFVKHLEDASDPKLGTAYSSAPEQWNNVEVVEVSHKHAKILNAIHEELREDKLNSLLILDTRYLGSLKEQISKGKSIATEYIENPSLPDAEKTTWASRTKDFVKELESSIRAWQPSSKFDDSTIDDMIKHSTNDRGSKIGYVVMSTQGEKDIFDCISKTLPDN